MRLRMLAKTKTPGFTVAAVLTLALGIGANTTMFSVLNTYLFRALPFPDSERLVRVFRTAKESQSWPHSVANFLAQRERNGVCAHGGVHRQRIQSDAGGPGQPIEGVSGYVVNADFLPALGVPAALGRVFTSEEDQPGRSAVAVLSDRFWRRRYGADPNIIGRRIEMDGAGVEVVGGMPPRFEHPLLWGSGDVWRPIAFTPEQRANRGNNYLRTFARLKPGVSIAQADAHLRIERR